MELSEYQARALRTDQTPQAVAGAATDAERLIPLLGLAGEAGQLLSEYKKRLRDGPGHALFVDKVAEELGDILWYVANLASKYGLGLDAIADQNLAKTADRFGPVAASIGYDDHFAENERLPRRFLAVFREAHNGARLEVRTEVDGQLLGAVLRDNSYEDDGYRFHDAFHLAFAAKLGWSPVLRGLLRVKRKSNPLIDEVEDGGRAAVIEEGMVAVAFDYARKHNYLEGISDVDPGLLTTMRGMGEHLEVAGQPLAAWREAILDGFAVWRQLAKNRGGRVLTDLDAKKVSYLGPAEMATTTAAALDPE